MPEDAVDQTWSREALLSAIDTVAKEVERRQIQSRRQEQLGEIGLSRVGSRVFEAEQPLYRGAAGFVEGAYEAGASVLDAIRDAAHAVRAQFVEPVEQLAQMARGRFVPGLQAPPPSPAKPKPLRPLGLVSALEQRNFLLEANNLERFSEDVGKIGGNVFTYSLANKAAALNALPAFAKNLVVLGGMGVAQARRSAALAGKELTDDDYGKEMALVAGTAVGAAAVDRVVPPLIEAMLRRPIGETGRRIVNDTALGALFEGAPTGFQPGPTLKGILGFNLGGTMGALFPGRVRPWGQDATERSFQTTARIMEQLKIGTEKMGALDPETHHDVRLDQLRNFVRSTRTPVTGEPVEINRADQEEMARQFNLPLHEVKAVVDEPFDQADVRREKVNAVASILAKEKGPYTWKQTLYERNMMGPAERLRWEHERGQLQRRPFQPEEFKGVTDEEVLRALRRDPDLARSVDAVTGFQKQERIPVPGGGKELAQVVPRETGLARYAGPRPQPGEGPGELASRQGPRPGERLVHIVPEPEEQVGGTRYVEAQAEERRSRVHDEIMRRIEATPGPRLLSRIFTPPAPEELVGGTRYAERQLPASERGTVPAVRSQVGPSYASEDVAKAQRSRLAKKNPANTYVVLPAENDRWMVSREIAPARERTQRDVLSAQMPEPMVKPAEGVRQQTVTLQPPPAEPGPAEGAGPESHALRTGETAAQAPPEVEAPEEPAGDWRRAGIRSYKTPEEAQAAIPALRGKKPGEYRAQVDARGRWYVERLAEAGATPAKVAARGREARRARRPPTMKELEQEYWTASSRHELPEEPTREEIIAKEDAVRRDMGDVLKGPNRGKSKYFLSQRWIWMRQWRTYGNRGQGFVDFLQKQPDDFFGGTQAKEAFVEENLAGGWPAAGKPTEVPGEIAPKAATKPQGEPAPEEVPQDPPVQGAAERTLREVLGAVPKRPVGLRTQETMDRAAKYLSSWPEKLAGAYDKATPEERAKIDAVVDKMDERRQVEDAADEAYLEVNRELEREQKLKPDFTPGDLELPLLLLGAGVGAYAWQRAKRDEKGATGPALAALFLAGFAGRPGKRPGGEDPIVRWTEALTKDAQTRRAAFEPEDLSVKNPKKGDRAAMEEAVDRANTVAADAKLSVEEAAWKVIPGNPQSKPARELGNRFVRSVTNALGTFGEFGQELKRGAVRLVNAVDREWKTAIHDMSTWSKLRFDHYLSTGDHRNLSDIMDNLTGKVLGDPEAAMPPPSSLKVETLVASWAKRQFGLSDPQLEHLWGRKLSADVQPNRLEFLRHFDDVLASVKDRALRKVPGFTPWQRSPYLPVIVREDAFGPSSSWEKFFNRNYAKDTERAAKIQFWMATELSRKMKITLEEGMSIIANHGEFRGRDPFFQYTLEDLARQRDKHLELHRLLDVRAGIEYDPARIMDRYYKPAITRIHFSEHFGPKGELAINLIKAARRSGYDGDEMLDLFDRATLQASPKTAARHAWLAEQLTGFTAFKFLGSAGLSQLTNWPRVMMEADAKHLKNAVIPAIRAQFYQSGWIPPKVRERLGSEKWARYVSETGSAGVAEMIQAALETKGLWRRAVHLEMRGNLATSFDRFGRNLAAITGRFHTGEKLDLYAAAKRAADAGNQKAMGDMEAQKQKLVSLFGQDPQLTALALRGKWTPTERQTLEQIGGQIVVNRTQFRTRAPDLPAAASDPWLRLLYVLQSFNFRGAAESLRQFNPRDPTSKISNPADRVRFFGALAATFGLSAGVRWLQKRMRGREEEWEDLPLYKKAADVASYGGFFPIFLDVINWQDYGAPHEQLLGPAVTTGLDWADAFYASARRRQVDPLARFYLRAVPVGYWNYLGVPSGSDLARRFFPTATEMGRRGEFGSEGGGEGGARE